MIFRLEMTAGIWIYDNLQHVHYRKGIITTKLEEGGDRKILDEIYYGYVHETKSPLQRTKHFEHDPPEIMCNRSQCNMEAWADKDQVITRARVRQCEDDSEGTVLLNCYVVTTVGQGTSDYKRYVIVEGAAGYIMNDDAQTIDILK